MSSYNLTKKASRDQYRADHQATLDSTKDGTWPRDLNDLMRWSAPSHTQVLIKEHPTFGRVWTEKDWAAHMCEVNLTYVNDLERRLAAGDPSLMGWEGWEPPIA